MGVGQVSIARLDVSDCEPAVDAISCATRRQPANRGRRWGFLCFLPLTLSLLAYDGYLAWEILGKLRLDTCSSSTDAAGVFAVVQVVAWLLLPVTYAAVSLNWRGETPWFPRPTGLCLLGVLTAVLEACAYVIG
jgi:hypothetical protein